jgi:two-component system sensor histidine kinase/response regulator
VGAEALAPLPERRRRYDFARGVEHFFLDFVARACRDEDAPPCSPVPIRFAPHCRRMSRTISIRQSLFASVIFLLLLTSAAILAVAAFAAIRGAEGLTRSVIDATEDRMSLEMERFLGEVERDLLIARDWAREHALIPTDTGQLNALFRPMIERSPQLSSILLSTSTGAEYMLLQDPGEPSRWVNRIVQRDLWGNRALFRRWDQATGESSESFEELEYDPRLRTYYRTAVQSDSGAVVAWTPPTVFFTTRDPGITAGAWWSNAQGSDTTVIAFDVLLLDLSRITTRASVSENGRAFIIASESPEDPPRIVGLPGSGVEVSDAELRTRLLRDSASLGPDALPNLPNAVELGVASVSRSIAAWEGASRSEDPIRFDVDGDPWWASFRARPLGSHGIWVAVVAPESDFLGNVVALTRQVAVASFLALLVAIILATRMARSYARPLEALAESSTRISNLELDAVPPIRSRLAEIKELADEQERMRVALDSFSRYMPVEIVRRLVAQGKRQRSVASDGSSRSCSRTSRDSRRSPRPTPPRSSPPT